MRPSTRRSRESSRASTSTRATSAAPARACWSRSPSPRHWWTSSSAAWRRCGWGTRWTRTPTWARSTRASSWRRSRSWSPPVRPTVFTGVAQSFRIAREEIFGPVLSVLTFRTPDEAVSKANNTPYGLSAGVWTEKGSRILEMARRLRAGVVWANTFNRFDPASPFGGYQESGFGREGGRHGLAAYLDLGR